ncbi:hypothetical protein ACFY88_14040, partial [Streptomyces sp. NPDC012616]
MPDPLRAAEAFRHATYRPHWKRVALRDGRVVARAAWWGGPDDSEPLTVEWFDFADGEDAAGAELLRTAPWRVGLELVMPGDWRADPVVGGGRGGGAPPPPPPRPAPPGGGGGGAGAPRGGGAPP